MIISYARPDGPEFRWINWNSEHATKHGCTVAEIESVVRNAAHGQVRNAGDGKYMVIGRGQGGRFIRVVFVKDEGGTIFVIHAMPVVTRRRKGGRRR